MLPSLTRLSNVCARALAFGCGYLVASVVWAAFTTDISHSSSLVFEFTEALLVVGFLRILGTRVRGGPGPALRAAAFDEMAGCGTRGAYRSWLLRDFLAARSIGADPTDRASKQGRSTGSHPGNTGMPWVLFWSPSSEISQTDPLPTGSKPSGEIAIRDTIVA